MTDTNVSVTGLELEVLNAVSDDAENLEQIYRQVALDFSSAEFESSNPDACYWREARDAAALSEIAEAVRSLVERGMLSVRLDGSDVLGSGDLSYVWKGWFEPTPAGRTCLNESRAAGLSPQLTSDRN